LKKLSIVIPNLNSPVIDATIRGLENQTLSKDLFEVIVVGRDDLGLVHQNDLVRFERTPEVMYPGQARNYGATQSTGEILVFIDADCVPRLDWLKIIYARFTEADISILGGSVEISSDNIWTLTDNLSLFHEYLNIHPPGTRSLLASLNLAIRRAAFDRVSGFDDSLIASEDSDISIRLRQAGYNLLFEPQAAVHHIPPRSTLRGMLTHHYHQGKHSIKVDSRYENNGAFPRLLRKPWILILFSLLLAAGATLRIYRSSAIIRGYILLAPLIYVSKIAWCIGAAHHPAR